MNMITRRNLAAIAICLTAPASLAYAQETLGSISGTVTDSSGAAIQGATVTLTNTDRNHVERTLKTNGKGFYTATSLPLGTYSVKIAQRGFKTELETSLVLHVNDALTANKALVAGNEGETVSVQADQVQLNLEDSTAAGLISGTQARELVLNNRNYEQLLNLQPGVVYGGANDQLYIGSTVPSGASNQVAFSINGGRATSNNFTVDGADNVDRGANLTLLTFPSIDAIAEFKTLRGQYTAQFGRGASGQINVITKSGTSDIHGSAYEFFRNDYLNANTWANKNFVNYQALASSVRPKLRYNDFGGTIGGPVVIPHLYNGRDKTFFFFSYEGRRVIQYTSGTALVPTAAERTGDFSNDYAAGNVQGPVAVCTAFTPGTGACTASGSKITNISPIAAAYLKDLYSVVPLPNSANDIASGLDPHTINSTVPNQFNNDQEAGRIDQAFGSRLNVFYRYVHDSLPVQAGAGTFTSVPIPGIANTTTRQPGTEHLGHGTYVFSPTLLLDMGYAYSRGAIEIDPVGALTIANSPDVKVALPYANTLGVIPTLAFSNNLTALGSTGIYRDYNINHNAFGSVTKVLGRTTLIAGVSYDHYQKRENNTGGNQGNFSFTNGTVPALAGAAAATTTEATFANFLLGNANGGTTNGFSQTSLAITPDIQENVLEAYIQDNWKIAPRLSLNIGVRYSYFGQPIDANGRLTNFDPDTFDATKAPTLDKTGSICLPGNAVATCVGFTPNAGADFAGPNYLNGIISGGGTVAGHASPYGNKVGMTDNTNFAPRLGFAFDVFGDGKTALRGGYGWSFDESEVSYYETEVFSNPPAVSTFQLAATSIDAITGASTAATTPTLTPGRIYGSPLNYKTPYVQQFSLDIQQEISPTLMLDIAYFGDHGTHLLGLVDINEAQPGAYVGKISPTDVAATCVYPGTNIPAYISTACDKGLNNVKPYKGYFAIDAVRSIFSSNYNSLQVKVTKKFAGKSLLDANYTWSKNLTNSQNDYSTPPQNTYNANADYGRSTIDRTNVLTVDGIYELPFMRDQQGLLGRVIGGWEVSGIFALNSGLPLTASASAGSSISYVNYTNNVVNGTYASAANGQTNGGTINDGAGLGISGSTNAGFRPNQIANPNQGYGRQIHTKNEFFYRGAFAATAVGSIVPGTEKRGAINGPGFNRLDVGIFRNFRIFDNLTFQLRGEAFNVVNHTNYQTVGVASTTASTFGVVTAARDNRILQIAGKITF